MQKAKDFKELVPLNPKSLKNFSILWISSLQKLKVEVAIFFDCSEIRLNSSLRNCVSWRGLH